MAFASSPWLRTFKTTPGTPRTDLVCFPPAGGSASAYHGLAKELAPGIAVAAVQYPGRQDRLDDPMIDTIEGMASAIAEAITASRSVGRPLALFGHSMGASVAFETARALHERGAASAHLIISGRIPPHHPRDTAFHKATDADLITELERLANDPASVQILREVPEIAEMVLPSVRNDYKAVETYHYQSATPSLDCPLTVFVADDDPTVTVEQSREWARHTTGPFDLVTFPGRHFYLDEQTEAVAKNIATLIGG
ncbi:thioesterase II family protein [Lolliginicoccus suaedae]|uniref:thioesterase II family protein n=1 Tax=Lolliginicoccus suaedae TaxID=2605429 RepID=UPI0011EBC05C|nr:alpha/beta fold hydrolase [Lolliginicoccus suaedae]